MPSSSTQQAKPSGSNTFFKLTPDPASPVVFGQFPVKNVGAVVPKATGETTGFVAFFNQRSFYRVAIVLGVGAAAFIGWKLYQEYRAKLESNTDTSVQFSEIENETRADEKESEATITNNNVVLYQCPRGYFTPCIAPFALKLESFLRVANIPYEIKFKGQPQSADSPWMTIGDEDIVESQNCIPNLCKIFNIDLNKNATENRKSAANLVDNTLENRIYWGIALWRWVYDNGNSLQEIQPLVMPVSQMIKDVSDSVKKASWYHGIGRFSETDVYQKINKDLEDLSAALGRHEFFLGTSPGEVDCNAFAMLSQMIWNMPKSPFETEIKKHSNLVSFVLRMKEKFWPDWNDILHSSDAESIASENVRLYSTGEFKRSTTGISSQNSKTSSIHISQEQLASLDTKMLENSSSNSSYKGNLLKNSLTQPEFRSTRSTSPSQKIQNQEQKNYNDDLKNRNVAELMDSNGNHNPFVNDVKVNNSVHPKEEYAFSENKETNLPSLPTMNVPNLSGGNNKAFSLSKATPFSEQAIGVTYPQQMYSQSMQMPQLNPQSAYQDQAKYYQLRDAINNMTAQVSTSQFQEGMHSNILKLNQLLHEFSPVQSQPQFPTPFPHQYPQQNTWNAPSLAPQSNIYDHHYMQQQNQTPNLNNPNQYNYPANNQMDNPFLY